MDLGVRLTGPRVEPLGHHDAVLDNEGAHQRIGVRVTPAATRDLDGAPHE